MIEPAGIEPALHLAYLTGEYPRPTDTFIQREVAGHRSRGVTVSTFAVRRPDPDQMRSEAQSAERDGTTSLLPSTAWAVARAHARLAVRSPNAYLRALRLARRTARPGLRGHVLQGAYFVEAGLLAAQLRRRRIDHLHNHLADSSCTVAMLASELSGVPFSFTLHGPTIFYEAHTWRLDEKLRRAAFCSCISYFARSQAAVFAPERLDRFHVVHCGVDAATVRPTVAEPGRSRILYVGRLTALKGMPVLLEAMVELLASAPDVELVVIGDGPDRADFEQEAQRLGVASSVSFRGVRSPEEVAEALASSDVFVLPSFAEGVPVSLMEALAAGVPVVATPVGGVGELVLDGVNGRLVRPADPVRLAAALAELLGDAELRSSMGVAGRELVTADFDARVESGRLLRLIRDHAAGRTSAVRPDPA